jgi:hypothetical protein
MAWFYYRLAHTTLSETGLMYPSLSGQVVVNWREVTKVECLKNGSIAIFTTTRRVVVPLSFYADRNSLAEFILGSAREVGATIHGSATMPNKTVPADAAKRPPRG